MPDATHKRMAQGISIGHAQHAIVLGARKGDFVSLDTLGKRDSVGITNNQARAALIVAQNLKTIPLGT